MPPLPRIFSTQGMYFSTKYTTPMFNKMATDTLNKLYSALSDKTVVKVPAPAISGNTNGMMVAASAGPSSLNTSMPKIISTAITKMTKAPATAKEDTFSANKLNTDAPCNNYTYMRSVDMMVGSPGLNFVPFAFKLNTMGMDLVISMMANSTTNALAISLK